MYINKYLLGISLTVDQWKIIKASLKDIDEAIEKVSK
jgi:hypothetical protein